MKTRFASLTLVALLFVAACDGADGDAGGGADGAGAVTSSSDVAASADTTPADDTPACAPACDGRTCGDDGCGGACGSCFDAHGQRAPGLCVAGSCCLPDCGGRLCGDDGCGGSCGACFSPQGAPAPELCVDGACCAPDCDGRGCGPDGCGGTCGTCADGLECTADFACAPPCEPACDGRCGGDDGCGGSCADRCAEELATCDPVTFTCFRRYPVCEDGPALPPDCPALEPAPTSAGDVRAFARENADALYCTEEDGERREFGRVLADVGDARVVMFGEVHGTSELGHVSADLFEALVRAGRVDAFGMEVGFDMTAALNTYIRTGGGPLVNDYGFRYYPPDLFLTTLVERARDLHEEGFELYAFGVDSPMRLAFVNEELTALAAQLPEDVAPLVLDGMPPVIELWDALPADYAAKAEAYREQVLAAEETVCAATDADGCERILQLVASFWIGAMHGSDIESMSDAVLTDFFARREQLIYYNFRQSLAVPERRAYAHMGAAHTCQSQTGEAYGAIHVAGFLAHDFEPTRGLVYSTHPAWGADSAIRYGGVVYDQPPEPSLLANALSAESGDEYAVPLDRPGQGCVTNPLQTTLHQSYAFVPYSDCYDALVYVRQLTPESYKKAGLHPAVQRLLQRRDAFGR